MLDGVLQGRDAQASILVVQYRDCLLNQLVRVKGHAVGGLAIDAAPQCLELLLVEVGVERVLLWAPVVADVGELARAEHAVNELVDLGGVGLQLWRQLSQCFGLLGIVIGAGDAVCIVGVVVLEQVLVDLLGQLRRDRHIASRSLQHLAGEEFFVGHLRACRQRVADVLLQCGHEVFVALAGHHGQHVHVVNDGGVIHAVAVLVDGQTQATPHFLAA